jgi:hypothetical protein
MKSSKSLRQLSETNMNYKELCKIALSTNNSQIGALWRKYRDTPLYKNDDAFADLIAQNLKLGEYEEKKPGLEADYEDALKAQEAYRKVTAIE